MVWTGWVHAPSLLKAIVKLLHLTIEPPSTVSILLNAYGSAFQILVTFRLCILQEKLHLFCPFDLQ